MPEQPRLDANGYVQLDDDGTPTPAQQRAQLRADAIARCNLCDDDGYRGGVVCDHRDHTEAATRGMAKIREAMGWNR